MREWGNGNRKEEKEKKGNNSFCAHATQIKSDREDEESSDDGTQATDR